MDGIFAVFLVSLALTVFAYLFVPVVIVNTGKKMKLKTIRKIAVINGIVVCLIINIIFLYFTDGKQISGISGILWAFVGYYMMKKKCLKVDEKKSDILPDNEYTSESKRHSLSDANNDIAPVGKVYGKDIALHPVEHNINYYTQKQESVTLQEKSIKTKKNRKPILAIVVLSVLMLTSIVINIIQLDKYNQFIDEYNQLIDEYSTLASDYNDTCESLNDAIDSRDYFQELLEDEREYNETSSEKAEFLDENIVFVLDGYGNYYYTYDQMVQVTQGVEEYSYWAYNKENAIYRGYTAWD